MHHVARQTANLEKDQIHHCMSSITKNLQYLCLVFSETGEAQIDDEMEL